MTQHPSLRSKEEGKRHRCVLKRYERIKGLKEKEKWAEGDSVFGLQKLKILKFKLKKEKAAPADEGAETAEGASKEVKTTGETKAGGKEIAPKKESGKK